MTHIARRALLWAVHGGFPFHLPARGATPALTRRRRHCRRLVLRHWPWALRPLAALAMCLCWPVGAALQTREALRKHRDRIAGSGIPAWRAGIAVWYASMRHNFPALETVAYDLWARRSPCPDAWFSEVETARLWPSLVDAEAVGIAGDKGRFADFCAAQGLPHAPTLACWRGGREVTGRTSSWPARVIVKPVSSSNAMGQELWTLSGGRYRFRDNLLSQAELAERARRQSLAGADRLAQPCLDLHPDLAARGFQGMPVARLITGRWPDGTARFVATYWVMPPPGAFASNTAAAGIKWPIDPGTGEILPDRGVVANGWTGVPTVHGARLPRWGEAVSAAVSGHRAFPGHVAALGWDVGFTPDGPVLFETNIGFAMTVPQTVAMQPAGLSPIGDLVDAWIRTPAPRARAR